MCKNATWDFIVNIGGFVMQSIISKFTDDFLDDSVTVYNYFPQSNCNYLFYCQIAGIQNIGKNYYNELGLAKEYQLQYTIEGSGSMTINGEEYILNKGDLLVLSNYQHHIFKPIEGKNWKIAFVHIFANELVTEIFKHLFNLSNYVIHGVDEEMPLSHINKIIKLMQEDMYLNEFAISSEIYAYLMDVCGFVSQNVSERGGVDSGLVNVIHYIKNNYNTPITMQDIMEHSTYSKNHLERLFKKHMHMTIQEYISYLRLKKSQELILTTNMYFSEIATAVGLSDYRSLIYLYRKIMGITPTEYKKRFK